MEPAGPRRVERRLAAILAADVAGYSRLMSTRKGPSAGSRRSALKRSEVYARVRAGSRPGIRKPQSRPPTSHAN
jgi:hypothetical protein